MTDSNKRKEGPGANSDNRGAKKNKGGSGGKWQTPHHIEKISCFSREHIEPGDVGVWATCARGQERRAAIELQSMLEEYTQKFYGLVSAADEEDGDGCGDDIESSIRKEVSVQKNAPRLFTPVHLDIVCVIFFKTRPPIDPVDLVQKICEDAASNRNVRRMKYVNRLTPMTLMGRATEKGLEDVGKAVLSKYFKLDEEERVDKGEEKEIEGSEAATFSSYAIRPTIRNHTALKRDFVIKQIAASISSLHKVDLTTPHKVILVEIYTTVCGMSVVGSDWEALKRFNLAELYQQPTLPARAALRAEAKPQGVTKDEMPPGAIITTAATDP